MHLDQFRDLFSIGWKKAFCLLLEELFSPILELLPFFAGSALRWIFLKLTAKRIGLQVFVAQNTSIRHCYDLSMGHHIGINQGCIIYCRGGVSIGNYVFLGQRVVINTGDHYYRDADEVIWKQGIFYSPIIIGNDVFIGMGAMILPGVTVADGTVVAAGAVVTHNTEPYSVVAGVPARIIGHRTSKSTPSH